MNLLAHGSEINGQSVVVVEGEKINKILNENCLTGLKNLPDNSIDCCVTSPPYYGLRDYGTDDQIGLEETPEQFVSKLVEVFTEVKRVLKPEGTLWLNLGDSYGGSGRGPAGNLMFHSMEYKYSSDVTDEKNAKKMKEAAIQTAVQTIRFLENLK